MSFCLCKLCCCCCAEKTIDSRIQYGAGGMDSNPLIRKSSKRVGKKTVDRAAAAAKRRRPNASGSTISYILPYSRKQGKFLMHDIRRRREAGVEGVQVMYDPKYRYSASCKSFPVEGWIHPCCLCNEPTSRLVRLPDNTRHLSFGESGTHSYEYPLCCHCRHSRRFARLDFVHRQTSTGRRERFFWSDA